MLEEGRSLFNCPGGGAIGILGDVTPVPGIVWGDFITIFCAGIGPLGIIFGPCLPCAICIFEEIFTVVIGGEPISELLPGGDGATPIGLLTGMLPGVGPVGGGGAAPIGRFAKGC